MYFINIVSYARVIIWVIANDIPDWSEISQVETETHYSFVFVFIPGENRSFVKVIDPFK